MDTFKAVYKILTVLERAMDYPEFDIEQIGPEALGVSKERWKGVSIKYDITGETCVTVSKLRITLKGLEYLQENSIMQRLYQTAKGFKEVAPFV